MTEAQAWFIVVEVGIIALVYLVWLFSGGSPSPVSSDPGHVGPKMDPPWWDLLRQVVMFALAIWLVVYSVVSTGHDIPFLITALILFGMIPTERIVDRYSRRGGSVGPEGSAPPTDPPPSWPSSTRAKE